MATGYIVWSEAQRKQLSQGYFTLSSEATAFITRLKLKDPKGAVSDTYDVVTVTIK